MIITDTHVHVYPCYDIQMLLNAAVTNFAMAAESLAIAGAVSPVVLLAESRPFDWFAAQRRAGGSAGAAGGWQIEATGETAALRAENRSGRWLYIMAGRQIVTRERLEVLALCTTKTFADHQPAVVTIADVAAAGGVPVLPWSPGKWFGSRGAAVNQCIENRRDAPLLLGDIAGRPRMWPAPSPFKRAERKTLKTLAGTDPLPLPGQERRVGNYGSLLPWHLDPDRPVTDMKQALTSGPVPTFYGKRCGWVAFIMNQLALRFGKQVMRCR